MMVELSPAVSRKELRFDICRKSSETRKLKPAHTPFPSVYFIQPVRRLILTCLHLEMESRLGDLAFEAD
jgi:hypothetical protein